MQARPVHFRKRLAQLKNQGFLGLMHGEEALTRQSQDRKGHDNQKQRILAHYFFSTACGALGVWGALRLGRGR